MSWSCNKVIYKPLNGSSYIELPPELRNPNKGSINLQNKDNECFRWCHIHHLNPQQKNLQRIKKADKQYIKKLDYSRIEFPVGQRHYNKIENQNSINMNVFGYEKNNHIQEFIFRKKNLKIKLIYY